MKIRQGFVSNSSSSSFVMIGVSNDNHEEYEEIEESLNDTEYEIVWINDDEFVTGYVYSRNEDMLEDGSIVLIIF